MTPLSDAELDAIEARARDSQAGHLPTDTRGLARTIELSTATRIFYAAARRDVLKLCGELRRVRQGADA